MRQTWSNATDSKRIILSGYAIWMALLLAVYYACGGLRVEAWGLIGLSGVLAVLAGVWLNRPARTVPWLLVAGALASFASGQLSFLIAAKLGVMLPFPSFADVLYLSEYPLVAGGLLIFVYWRSPGGDRRSLIDALTLTAGLGLLSWTFLIRPYVTNGALSGLQKSVAIGYPLGDVLILALLVRLLAPGTGRIRCVYYLAAGMIACLVSDSAYGWIELHGVFSNGTVVDLGWALFYGALGAAALHPSMTRLTEPVPRQGVEVSPARLALLMLASLIAPVVLLTTGHGSTGDVSVVAVFSAVLYLLVLTRLWDAAASHRRALDRERVLRQAGQPLVTAADVPQVAATVKDAIGALLDGHAQGEAVLGVRIDGTLRTVGRAADPADSRNIEYLAAAWLALGSGTAPVITPVERLPEKVATDRPDAEWVLLCPLSLPERPSVDAMSGLIAVFGEQRALSDLAATVEILARQVALTLEGIMLRQEAIRQRNEAYFRAVVQDASDAIVIAADDGTVKYTTPSTVAIFGVVPAAGERLWDLVAAQEREEFAHTFMRLREWARFGPRVVETQTVRRDGSRVYIQVRCSDLRAEPNVAGLVFTLRDVTAQHKLEAELKHRAFHDALTGLPNRLLFQERVASAGASAGTAGPVAGVLFIDLDDFKVVNDTKGHSVGDELLVAAGARLSALVREQDSAARLGGDEFALLVGSADDSAAVEAIAARIVDAFAEPFQLTAGMVTITVTVGVATTDDSTDTDELLRHADLALYAAKAAGKRQWRRWQPVLSAGLIRRHEIQEALEEAVASSAFRLVYQPIVALGTGELAGFEALIRWPHPEWGMMNPDQFITLAEETGQIIPIGAWVLGQATADIMRCRQAARQRSQPGGGRGLYIAVNVSARQFADPDFANTVRQVLATTGLESRSLLLELTESALLRRDERLHSDLAALKGIGVRLAIDDFGTGYSSLSYLRDLPMSVVKMDKSFVDGIADSNQRLALAEGIVQIARTLDLEVVAEGIETEVQRDLLSLMGCHYGQGYLLARPMPADQAVELAATGFTAATLVPEPRH